MPDPDEPLTPDEIEKAMEEFVARAPKCSAEGCSELASYRFTWPGRDEQPACTQHALKAKQVAAAMGMHLQVRTL